MGEPLPHPIHNRNCLLRMVQATKWEVFSFIDPGDGLMLQAWKPARKSPAAVASRGRARFLGAHQARGGTGPGVQRGVKASEETPGGVTVRTGKKVSKQF